MRTADIAKFKGSVKSAMYGWAEQQIDALLPNRSMAKSVLKNAANNMIARYGAKIDNGIDAIVLLFGDTEGNLDSDTLTESACNLLQEMPITEYSFGAFTAKAGNGEISICFPRGFISEIFAGDLNGVKFTVDDIREIKKYF